jgi:hypothetical protein
MAGEVSEIDWFQDVWTWYFHDPDDTNWTFESYVRLTDVSTMQDFWSLHTPILPLVGRGMFFVMRESVFPCWDDPLNIEGGCASMKVATGDICTIWDDLLKRILGETLATDATANSLAINGISVSPKRGFSVIKIWFVDNRFENGVRDLLRIPPAYAGDIVYRRNRDNIQIDATKQRGGGGGDGGGGGGGRGGGGGGGGGTVLPFRRVADRITVPRGG